MPTFFTSVQPTDGSIICTGMNDTGQYIVAVTDGGSVYTSSNTGATFRKSTTPITIFFNGINTANLIANNRQNNLYDYSKVNYINAREKVCIICKIHGDFLQSPNDHLNGCGCQKCGLGNYSKICITWLNTIMINDKIFIQHSENLGEKQIIIDGKSYKCDGYCEETNTIYEFYGDIWHGNPKKYNKDDFNILNKKTFGELYQETINREKILTGNGYNLITIWESEFNK